MTLERIENERNAMCYWILACKYPGEPCNYHHFMEAGAAVDHPSEHKWWFLYNVQSVV